MEAESDILSKNISLVNVTNLTGLKTALNLKYSLLVLLWVCFCNLFLIVVSNSPVNFFSLMCSYCLRTFFIFCIYLFMVNMVHLSTCDF